MGKKRSSRRKKGRKIVRIMAVLLFVWLAVGVMQNRDSIFSSFSEITGTEYEPWHYRYVGREVAEEIFNNRICLEEYFGK